MVVAVVVAVVVVVGAVVAVVAAPVADAVGFTPAPVGLVVVVVFVFVVEVRVVDSSLCRFTTAAHTASFTPLIAATSLSKLSIVNTCVAAGSDAIPRSWPMKPL